MWSLRRMLRKDRRQQDNSVPSGEALILTRLPRELRDEIWIHVLHEAGGFLLRWPDRWILGADQRTEKPNTRRAAGRFSLILVCKQTHVEARQLILVVNVFHVYATDFHISSVSTPKDSHTRFSRASRRLAAYVLDSWRPQDFLSRFSRASQKLPSYVRTPRSRLLVLWPVYVRCYHDMRRIPSNFAWPGSDKIREFIRLAEAVGLLVQFSFFIRYDCVECIPGGGHDNSEWATTLTMQYTVWMGKSRKMMREEIEARDEYAKARLEAHRDHQRCKLWAGRDSVLAGLAKVRAVAIRIMEHFELVDDVPVRREITN